MELTLHDAYELFTIKHLEVKVSHRCFESKMQKTLVLKHDCRLVYCCSYHANTDQICKCLNNLSVVNNAGIREESNKELVICQFFALLVYVRDTRTQKS